MGLFSSSKSKQTTNVTDARVGAEGGSIVAQGNANVTLSSLDPSTVSQSLGLARFAIQEATRGADKIASGALEQTAASREREQALLAAAVAPDAAGGGELLRTVVIVAAIAGVAFVLVTRR